MKMPLIFIDMDGVLADLHNGMVHFTKDPMVGNDRNKLFQEYLPSYASAGMFCLQDKLIRSDELVAFLLDLQSHGHVELAILTSAGQFYKPVSDIVSQKKRWLERCFPELVDIPFCATTSGADKSILANNRSFLLDDHTKNVIRFIAGGGYGFVYNSELLSEAKTAIRNFIAICNHVEGEVV